MTPKRERWYCDECHYTMAYCPDAVRYIPADAVTKLVEAAKLARRELGFMLSAFPERGGGLYEDAYSALRLALREFAGGEE